MSPVLRGPPITRGFTRLIFSSQKARKMGGTTVHLQRNCICIIVSYYKYKDTIITFDSPFYLPCMRRARISLSRSILISRPEVKGLAGQVYSHLYKALRYIYNSIIHAMFKRERSSLDFSIKFKVTLINCFWLIEKAQNATASSQLRGRSEIATTLGPWPLTHAVGPLRALRVRHS